MDAPGTSMMNSARRVPREVLVLTAVWTGSSVMPWLEGDLRHSGVEFFDRGVALSGVWLFLEFVGMGGVNGFEIIHPLN